MSCFNYKVSRNDYLDYTESKLTTWQNHRNIVIAFQKLSESEEEN